MGPKPSLDLLGYLTSRGGVLGNLEVRVGPTGWGVAAEAMLPDGVLDRDLAAARERIVSPPAPW